MYTKLIAEALVSYLKGGGSYGNRVTLTPTKNLTNNSAAQLFYKETLTRYLEVIKITTRRLLKEEKKLFSRVIKNKLTIFTIIIKTL